MVDAPIIRKCRFCSARLSRTFVDLGVSPLCQTHIDKSQINDMEPFYPLHALVCDECFLVQLDQYVSASDIFEEYAYFSSYSGSWLKHASEYCDMAENRFSLDENSFVVELASNDGYLLQNFVRKGIPCLGVEPAANVAKVARDKGIETVIRFFGAASAAEIENERSKADLIVGNNVLAHVPDLNDFVAGLLVLLAENGTVTMEFPHLLRLMEEAQFDTVYHEHFSYFSFIAVEQVFRAHEMKIIDVEQLATHGGSLRIYAQHLAAGISASDSVDRLRAEEREAGLDDVSTYMDFQKKVDAIKRDLLEFLISAKRSGKTIVGYGAPGKGNTLLNYCGIRTDFLDYTVDRNPYKQNKFTPGSRIPIFSPERIRQTRPEYVLILPWNLRDEIVAEHAYIRDWGGRFVVPIPAIEVIDPA